MYIEKETLLLTSEDNDIIYNPKDSPDILLEQKENLCDNINSDGSQPKSVLLSKINLLYYDHLPTQDDWNLTVYYRSKWRLHKCSIRPKL